MEDAARLDGASRFRILWSIIPPMTLAVLAVFTFVNNRNSFLWPLIIISGQVHATVPLGLNMFVGQYGNQWNFLMAASTISIVPCLVLILATQRYLVAGIALTGIGGRQDAIVSPESGPRHVRLIKSGREARAWPRHRSSACDRFISTFTPPVTFPTSASISIRSASRRRSRPPTSTR